METWQIVVLIISFALIASIAVLYFTRKKYYSALIISALSMVVGFIISSLIKKDKKNIVNLEEKENEINQKMEDYKNEKDIDTKRDMLNDKLNERIRRLGE